MLTDWSEVLVERDADANAYPDISIEVIELILYNVHGLEQ